MQRVKHLGKAGQDRKQYSRYENQKKPGYKKSLHISEWAVAPLGLKLKELIQQWSGKRWWRKHWCDTYRLLEVMMKVLMKCTLLFTTEQAPTIPGCSITEPEQMGLLTIPSQAMVKHQRIHRDSQSRRWQKVGAGWWEEGSIHPLFSPWSCLCHNSSTATNAPG